MRHLCQAEARANQSAQRTHLPDAPVPSRDADRDGTEEGRCDLRLNSGGKSIDCLIKYMPCGILLEPGINALHARTSSGRLPISSATRRRTARAERRFARKPGRLGSNISNKSKTWASVRLLASPHAGRFRGPKEVCAKRPRAKLPCWAMAPHFGTIMQHIEHCRRSRGWWPICSSSRKFIFSIQIDNDRL